MNVHLANRVLIPVRGDHYGLVLERGELKLAFDAPSGSFSVFYFGHRFPVDPREYPRILERAVRTLGLADLAGPAAAQLSSLIAAFGHFPEREIAASEPIAERHGDKDLHKHRLAQLAGEAPAVRDAIERAVRIPRHGDPGFQPRQPGQPAPGGRCAPQEHAGSDDGARGIRGHGRCRSRNGRYAR